MVTKLYEGLRTHLRPRLHAWRHRHLRHHPHQQQNWSGKHHPSIKSFTPWLGQADGVFLYNFLGVKTDPKFRNGFKPTPKGMHISNYPHPDQTYFELLFLINSVNNAGGKEFSMIELGAGYGYWLVIASKLLERAKGEQVVPRLTGVEMETGRFHWMEEHFSNNGLDPTQHHLIHAAVSDHSGSARYLRRRDSSSEYGLSLQRIVGWRSYRGAGNTAGGTEIRCVSLRDLLESENYVNFVHVDVQREEWVVIRHGLEELTKKVGWLLIGTHSSWQYRRLQRLLERRGWRPVYRYPGYRCNQTPFGNIFFLDGLLAYKNPHPDM